MSDIAIWIALGSLVLNFVTILFATQRSAVKNAEARRLEFAHLENRIRDAAEITVRNFGESVAALREKIVQTELWNRDNFVLNTTFVMVVNDIKDGMTKLEMKIDRRFDSTDRRLEKLANGERD